MRHQALLDAALAEGVALGAAAASSSTPSYAHLRCVDEARFVPLSCPSVVSGESRISGWFRSEDLAVVMAIVQAVAGVRNGDGGGYAYRT
jgi:hypothetical protein